MAWECIILDDRRTSQSAQSRIYGALGNLAARFRLLLSSGMPAGSPNGMFNSLHYLQPKIFQSAADVADGFEVRLALHGISPLQQAQACPCQRSYSLFLHLSETSLMCC